MLRSRQIDELPSYRAANRAEPSKRSVISLAAIRFEQGRSLIVDISRTLEIPPNTSGCLLSLSNTNSSLAIILQ